jgi:type IV pilus assembly protein PilM
MVMSLLTAKKTEWIGLDVGTRSVKLVRLRRGELGYCVTAAGMADMPPVENGEGDTDSSRVTAALKECLARAQVRERYAVCGVAGPEVMVRGFKFPPLPLKALDQAVHLEAQSVCPLDIKSSVLDYQLVQPVSEGAGQPQQEVRSQSGLMVVGTDRLIRQRVSQVTAAGIKPVLMDAEALALLNCLNELNLIQGRNTVAVIDIGYSTTSVIIYGQNGLPFVRDLTIAGGSIIRQISTEQGLDEKTVCQTLCGFGEESISKEQRNQMLLALNNAIRPLVTMINETLRFYSFQEKNAAVEQIFLCGGFSLIPMFTDMLTDALPVETGLLNPLEHMAWDASQPQNEWKACGPALAIAAGLAMRTE